MKPDRRQYMQRPTSTPAIPRHFVYTWSAGKEPDALSKLVTGGIFNVEKLLYAFRGMHSPHNPLASATADRYDCYWRISGLH